MVIVRYQSSCMGLTYPAARTFKEIMLGSVMVSSVWGLVRRYPKKRPFAQWASSKCELLIWREGTHLLPTTSSQTSFHSTSALDSCTMVTIILLCRPCSRQRKDVVLSVGGATGPQNHVSFIDWWFSTVISLAFFYYYTYCCCQHHFCQHSVLGLLSRSFIN